jgi:hypothetical protein
VGFFLFVLMNATLFIRPAEFIPALMGAPIYEVLILSCIACYYPGMVAQLSPRSLAERPITVCLLGLLACIGLSDLAHGWAEQAVLHTADFCKHILYYLLLISVVNSPRRLRQYLVMVAGFTAIIMFLAVLHNHEVIHIKALDPELPKPLAKRFIGREDEIPAKWWEYFGMEGDLRLKGTGIFGDPNEVCALLVVAMIICIYLASDRRAGQMYRAFWGATLLMFLHALHLTGSRGGLVSFVIGMVFMLVVQYGRRAIPRLAVAMPAALLFFLRGRQANFEIGSGSGHERILLWSEGLRMLSSNPLFGAGPNQYMEIADQAAHNAFIHVYGELGFPAGTMFLGMFAVALLMPWQLGSSGRTILDPELRRFRPYMMTIVGGCAGAMLSVSIHFNALIYAVLGLATAYTNLAVAYPPPPPIRSDMRLAMQMTLLGMAFIAAVFLFVRKAGFGG